MGVVVHVEIVSGSAEEMQVLINDRLEAVPRYDLPLGVCAYPSHVNPEPNGSEWIAVISYQVDSDDATEASYEPAPDDEEAKYVPAGPNPDAAMAVGTAVGDVHVPRIDWNS